MIGRNLTGELDYRWEGTEEKGFQRAWNDEKDWTVDSRRRKGKITIIESSMQEGGRGFGRKMEVGAILGGSFNRVIET